MENSKEMTMNEFFHEIFTEEFLEEAEMEYAIAKAETLAPNIQDKQKHHKPGGEMTDNYEDFTRNIKHELANALGVDESTLYLPERECVWSKNRFSSEEIAISFNHWQALRIPAGVVANLIVSGPTRYPRIGSILVRVAFWLLKKAGCERL